MQLYAPILPMVAYCGVIIMRHHYHNWWDYKTKNYQQCATSWSHYSSLCEPWTHKLPDIVKLYTCQLFYDHLINEESLNLNLSLVSEQHDYATRSASLQHLPVHPESFRVNIRKFCPTILGCYYWNDIPLTVRNEPTRKLFKKALYQFYFAQYWQFQHYIFVHYAFTFSSPVYFYPKTNVVD